MYGRHAIIRVSSSSSVPSATNGALSRCACAKVEYVPSFSSLKLFAGTDWWIHLSLIVV